MYEKPQYLSPDGSYRRRKKNPTGKGGRISKRKELRLKSGMGSKKISPETAKLIAKAIQSIFHSDQNKLR